MPFDTSTARTSERVFLSQDCWDALNLIHPRMENRDKFIENAVWEALAKYPGLIDCINVRKEAFRKFKEQMKADMLEYVENQNERVAE